MCPHAGLKAHTLLMIYFVHAKRAPFIAPDFFLNPGMRVLDLGCSPGSWMQVACQELGPREKGGLVLGIDIQASDQKCSMLFVCVRVCVCVCAHCFPEIMANALHFMAKLHVASFPGAAAHICARQAL
eukprot:1157983-Pelagomonas_calceolata.AAC.6